MKAVWIFVLILGRQPLGVVVTPTEHECFVQGNVWIEKHLPHASVLGRCVPNDEVDKEFPNLGWL